ncbi:MAG TPA: hypothetical protein VHD90_24135 [Phototrophicaceae bacterium]|nr:hypothetical protein [Phototrophicaceae bacterium]
MEPITYEVVARLAEQLSPEAQKALIAHLQEIAKQRELSFEEWKALFDSAIDYTPVVNDISPRRVDWYDDDGR